MTRTRQTPNPGPSATGAGTGTERGSGTGRRAARRRWPLLLIGGSAGTATWSGWVGLGQLTGFGVVRPLPGIADHITINTAVTLPIGVEAYAMYALSIATSSRPLARRTRRYAWASSAAALILGMAGQVAYHLMTATNPTAAAVGSGADGYTAPWQVVAVVSCLPVLVLGAASLLWHLAGHEAPEADSGSSPEDSPQADDGSAPMLAETIPIEATGSAAIPVGGSVDPIAEDWIHGSTPTSVGASIPSRVDMRPRIDRRTGRRVALVARSRDVRAVREAIASGDLPPEPTAKDIRLHLSISPAYARATRDAVRDPRTGQGAPLAPPQPSKANDPTAPTSQPAGEPDHATQRDEGQNSDQHRTKRQASTSEAGRSDQQSAQQEYQESAARGSQYAAQKLSRKAMENDQESHTYATPLP